VAGRLWISKKEKEFSTQQDLRRDPMDEHLLNH
jgi:hypothetical protein